MKIHAVQTGTVTIRPNQRQGKGIGLARLVNTLFDRRWTESLPIYAWVIEHPEEIIVIDTGANIAGKHKRLSNGSGSLPMQHSAFIYPPMIPSRALALLRKRLWTLRA